MKTKYIIIIVLAVVAGVGIYLVTRPTFTITTIDKTNRSVTYTFKGKSYTHVYGAMEMGVSDGNYSVMVENLSGYATAGISVSLVKGGKTIKQETVYF